MAADNPYKIEGPALISFSGGRTSGFMLHQIVQAHGGMLPDDVVVCFANTGKEREETLRFVHECGSRWGVRVNWVEWRDTKPGYEVVGFNSCSRNGEPFAELIAKKHRLPNWQERWCTQFLKVRAMHDFVRATLGVTPGQFTEVIGLRNDEGLRLMKGMARASDEGRTVVYPLAAAHVSRQQVIDFWARQPFDLALRGHEGNCDLCFMKGRGIRKSIIRANPDCARWWQRQEEAVDGFFDRRDRVADLEREVRQSPMLPFDDGLDDEHDVECGLHCAAE